jgi:hypothetical protein
MFKNYTRKQKIRDRYYQLFIHYREKGDWVNAGIYAEKYFNFGKRKNENENNSNLSGVV